MKHSVCAGVIEIRTDPKNTAYVVVEGARKQYEGGEAEGGGVIRVRPLLGEEDDGGVMGKLEKDKVEEGLKKEHESRIEELRKLSERQWADPYEHSRKMRRIFRVCTFFFPSPFPVPPPSPNTYPYLFFLLVHATILHGYGE